MVIREEMGERIRALRQGLGLSQLALAQRVGAGRAATVSEWERDRAQPERGTLRLLADLTAQPEEVYVWLLSGGARPSILPRTKAATPGTVSALVASLPPFPKIEMDGAADMETVRLAYAEFMRRLATLAAEGRVVPAHHLLEWAAMLVRTQEMYSLVAKRLQLILAAVPLMIFELNTHDVIVGAYFGADVERTEERKSMAFENHTLPQILPAVAPDVFARAVDRARREVTSGFVFLDGSRRYSATLNLLPDGHIMVFVQRLNPTRQGELRKRGDERVG